MLPVNAKTLGRKRVKNRSIDGNAAEGVDIFCRKLARSHPDSIGMGWCWVRPKPLMAFMLEKTIVIGSVDGGRYPTWQYLVTANGQWQLILGSGKWYVLLIYFPKCRCDKSWPTAINFQECSSEILSENLGRSDQRHYCRDSQKLWVSFSRCI